MPDWQQEVKKQLAGLRLTPTREAEIVEELAQHLEDCYLALLAGGATEDQAARTALAQFSERKLLEQELRRVEQQTTQDPIIFASNQRSNMIADLWQDLRYGARMLVKNSGFTAVAIITLTLGIGANTAIFSVVNAVLLKPLPFHESERLVMIWNRGAAAAGGDRTPLAVADLLDLQAQNQSFAEVGAFQYVMYSYIGSESPERVQGTSVTANFFSLLGIQPVLGRQLTPDDERPGAPRVAMLSDRFWRNYFNADPDVLGQTLNLSGTSATIIGVLPPNLDFPNKDVQLWTALQLQPPTRRGPYFLTGVARLKPGIQFEQARTEALGDLISSYEGELDLTVVSVNNFIVGNVRLALLVLFAAVTLVLLIASVNVANLMLVRSAARVKEISIRAALGAGRARIIRQLLTESLLLALTSGVLGVLLAMWGVRVLLQMAPDSIPRLNHIGINGSVLAWTALVSLVVGVLFGLAPAWQSSRLSLNESLKESGRGASESPGKRRWRNLLVVSELALAVMLLIGAGLLIKSFWRLQHVDAGVNTERVLTMQLALRGQRYANPEQVDAFYPRLVERIQSLPGVRAAVVSNSLPPDSTEFSDDFTIEGRPANRDEMPPIAYLVRVSPDYFRTFDIPLRAGRYFISTDIDNAPLVTLINETMARQFFPNEDPLGKRINTGDEARPTWWQIVGVVGDVKYTGLADQMQPTLYQPLVQATSWNAFLSVKTEAVNPLSLAAAVRQEIKSLDEELPVSKVGTLEQRFDTALAQVRFRTTLIALFALVALVLAVVGIYGVISYSVTERTHELGIRLALGAQTGQVLNLVLKQGAGLAVIGVLIGLVTSFALTRWLDSLLFNVSATDWQTFSGIAALLMTVALVACYIPARRATRVDPLVALRYE